MPIYTYKAKKNTNEALFGEISAQNQDEALDKIYGLGLVPVSVEEKTFRGGLVSEIRTSRIKQSQLLSFTKQLASLIKSGVPLLRALELISQQTPHPYFAQVIADIAGAVKSGRAFSSCLNDYPDIFDSLYVAMVHAGEEMGNLRDVLTQMSQYQTRQHEFTSKIRAALIYPALMLTVGLLTIFFILTFVMPKMAVVFADAGQKLPWPTVVVLGLSHWLTKFWWIGLISLGALFVVFDRWRRTVMGQQVLGLWALSIWGIKQFVIDVNMARFTQTLFLLLASGLSLVKSLEIAVATVTNPQLRQQLLMCAQAITAGESFSQALASVSLMPPMMVGVIGVAQETGSLEEALKDLAQSYEEGVQDVLKAITSLIEPVLILLIGSIIAFIVFAMLLPIFSMDLLSR